MASPTTIARRRGYILTFLVRNWSAGIREIIEDLVFAATRDKGYVSLPAPVHDDLVFLGSHKLAEGVPIADEITGERQTFWRATTRGKAVTEGHAELPDGLEL